MKWSLNLGRIAGIKLFIHWTFLILLGWVIFSQWQVGKSWDQILVSSLFVLTIFGCVVLHELGHALMARKFNITTKDITLLPIGGLARLEKIPEDPKQELLVALAGPAVNVGISLLIGIYLLSTDADLIPQIDNLDQMQVPSFLASLFLVNLILAVFNLIPAFPMDGGRVFRALLAFRFTRLEATRMAVGLGQFIAIIFAFVGLFYNPFLLLIAIFVYLGAQFELNQVEQKSQLHDFTVADVMMRKYHTLQASEVLMQAVGLLLDSQEKDFVVMDGTQAVGVLTAQGIIKGLKQGDNELTVAKVMNTSFRELAPAEPLDKVFEELQAKKLSILPVVKNRQLIGVLNMENVMEFIMVQHAMISKPGSELPWLTKRSLREPNIT